MGIVPAGSAGRTSVEGYDPKTHDPFFDGVTDQLAALWGDGAAWGQSPGVKPYEAHLLEVDSARAQTTLGWTPKWRLDQGLKRTVDWYRAVKDGQDARDITLAQIEDHLNG